MRGRTPWLLGWLCLAGCAGHALTPPPAGGAVEVQFTISTPKVPGLVLTSCSGCTLGLEHLALLGDVSATAQATLHDAQLNPVMTAAQKVAFIDLPQGVYSQLEFNVVHVWIEGSFMGVPLSVRAETEALRVDLRVSPPPELTDGTDQVMLPVSVDADAWWHDVDLTQLPLDDGRILIDVWHNPDATVTIARAIGNCFSVGKPIQ
jgi:hypothetical protein